MEFGVEYTYEYKVGDYLIWKNDNNNFIVEVLQVHDGSEGTAGIYTLKTLNPPSDYWKRPYLRNKHYVEQFMTKANNKTVKLLFK